MTKGKTHAAYDTLSEATNALKEEAYVVVLIMQ